MPRENKILVAVAIIFIIILIVIMIKNRSIQHDVLNIGITGLWMGDPDFCRKSEIDGIMIYIGPKIEGIDAHKAYIIMYADNAIILQKSIQISVAPTTSFSLFATTEFESQITLSDDDSSTDDQSDSQSLAGIMPLNQQMKYSPVSGMMTWTGLDDDGRSVVYANFYRDNVGSAQK
mgnify:CR=1 FL=1